jgi:undecaprenyl-diphosphatase
MSTPDLATSLQSFSQFFKSWFSKHWQFLIVLLLGIYVPLQIFIILALEIWRNRGGLQWDISILELVHGTANTRLDGFVKTLTHFGTTWGVFPLCAVISVVLLSYRRWRSLTYFLINVGGCCAINQAGKNFWHRDRPALWEYPPEQGFSFPSGHAMSSMMLVAGLVILMWPTRWRWTVLGFGSLFVMAIGWTRLYLGVHYPSDVLAGWMVSLSWAIGVSLLIRPHFKPPNLLKDQAEDVVPEDELIPQR